MNENNVIPIFFTIDEKYAPYAGVAVYSIKKNASKKYNYRIFILHQELSEKSMEKISKMEDENFKIDYIYMKKGLESITDRAGNRLRCDYFTLTIYFRLFIADMFPQYDKGIYLDSDIVVPGDISELYNMNLEENILAASPDHSIETIPIFVDYLENAIGVKWSEYINSGVLLMDLKKMRANKFSNKFLTLLNKYHFDSVAPDQDYINAMCNGKILFLDRCWDAMPNNDLEAQKNPKLIHYNLFQKPWCYDNIQYEDYFWNYAKNTDFYNDIVEFKNSYSDSQKKSDMDCLNTMLNRAKKITATENTFKKRYENGEDIRL